VRQEDIGLEQNPILTVSSGFPLEIFVWILPDFL